MCVFTNHWDYIRFAFAWYLTAFVELLGFFVLIFYRSRKRTECREQSFPKKPRIDDQRADFRMTMSPTQSGLHSSFSLVEIKKFSEKTVYLLRYYTFVSAIYSMRNRKKVHHLAKVNLIGSTKFEWKMYRPDLRVFHIRCWFNYSTRTNTNSVFSLCEVEYCASGHKKTNSCFLFSTAASTANLFLIDVDKKWRISVDIKWKFLRNCKLEIKNFKQGGIKAEFEADCWRTGNF